MAYNTSPGLSFNDTTPSAEEQTLVRTALQQRSLWQSGPWLVSASAPAMEQGEWGEEDDGYRAQELPYAQVRHLWDETIQRYPELARYR